MALPPIVSLEDIDDVQFMENVYTEHRRLMYVVALRILHDRADVEDVINTAFEALIVKIPTIKRLGCCELRSYVVSTIRNTALTYVVKRSRRGKHELEYGDEMMNGIPNADSDVDKELLLREDIQTVRCALERLPMTERALLRMKYYEGRSDQGIAEVLCVKAASVRMYLTRARRHVQEQIALGGTIGEE